MQCLKNNLKVLYGYFYSFPRVARTKYHRLGGFNNRNKFSPCSGSWKLEMKVLAGLETGSSLVPGRDRLLSLDLEV